MHKKIKPILVQYFFLESLKTGIPTFSFTGRHKNQSPVFCTRHLQSFDFSKVSHILGKKIFNIVLNFIYLRISNNGYGPIHLSPDFSQIHLPFLIYAPLSPSFRQQTSSKFRAVEDGRQGRGVWTGKANFKDLSKQLCGSLSLWKILAIAESFHSHSQLEGRERVNREW